jgi:hypothetical protein
MKRGTLQLLGTILAMTFATTAAWGGEDVSGANDHPVLPRYPDTFITQYTNNYNPT